jgi:LPS-assembly lipoprotein
MRAFALLVVLALAGCGWAPTYAPARGQANSHVAVEMAAIYVPVLPERTGQLMRQALQDRLERFNLDAPKRYELNAYFSVSQSGEAIDPNSNVTRIRYTGAVDWVLRNPDNGAIVAKGSARALDGIDVFDSQFFASNQENEPTERRLAEGLADQVVSQLSGYFTKTDKG